MRYLNGLLFGLNRIYDNVAIHTISPNSIPQYQYYLRESINQRILREMVRISFDICVPSQSIMDESFGKNLASLAGAPGTLQDIAYNIVQERSNSTQPNDSGTKERTIFVLGSKGVVSIVNKFWCLQIFSLVCVCEF